MFNAIILYVTLILSYNFIYKITKKSLLSKAMALIFAVSPIVISQVFSYYNDGALYCALLCLILEFIIYILKGPKKQLFTVFCLIIICCNIKFTGLAYGGIFGLGLYLVYLFFNRKDIKNVKIPTAVFATAVILAIFVVGAQPYVTNFINKGNPLYPLAGEGKVNIMTYNQPAYLNDKTTIQKFSISMFSKASNMSQINSTEMVLKIPFTIYKDELQTLSRSDVRVSGFGLYFSGIFVISLLVLLASFVSKVKNKRIDRKFCIFACIFALSVL